MNTGNETLFDFAVYDRDGGEHLGTYHVASKEEALEELAKDAGYESFREACADIEGFGEGLGVKHYHGRNSPAVKTLPPVHYD